MVVFAFSQAELLIMPKLGFSPAQQTGTPHFLVS